MPTPALECRSNVNKDVFLNFTSFFFIHVTYFSDSLEVKAICHEYTAVSRAHDALLQPDTGVLGPLDFEISYFPIKFSVENNFSLSFESVK